MTLYTEYTEVPATEPLIATASAAARLHRSGEQLDAWRFFEREASNGMRKWQETRAEGQRPDGSRVAMHWMRAR